MGRRKVEMKRLTDKSSRQVTFSKRRSGLFKKANELSTLCAVRVAVIVFSPGGKPFSFGHPSVDSVVSQFSSRPRGGIGGLTREDETATAEEMSRRLGEVGRMLEAEKRKGKVLEMMMTMMRKGMTEEEIEAIEELGLGELQELKAAMEVERRRVRMQAREAEASSSLLLLANQTHV